LKSPAAPDSGNELTLYCGASRNSAVVAETAEDVKYSAIARRRTSLVRDKGFLLQERTVASVSRGGRDANSLCLPGMSVKVQLSSQAFRLHLRGHSKSGLSCWCNRLFATVTSGLPIT